MTLQAIPGGLWLPGYPNATVGVPSFTALTIDAADEGVASVFRISKTGNITKVLWTTGTTTTGATITVRGETLDESVTPAIPSGTLYHANFTGTTVIAGSDDNVPILTSITSTAVTAGDKIAIVIKQPNTSFGTMQVRALFTDHSSANYPYVMLNTGVSPAVSWGGFGGGPVIGLEYDDGSYSFIPGAHPLHTVTSTNFNNTSTPDEIGLRFKLPFPARVAGYWVWGDFDGDWNINLYDSDGATKLITRSHDHDERLGTGTNPQEYRFVTPVNLLGNTYYRIVQEPSSATTCQVNDFTVNTAAVMDAFQGGQNFHLTSAKNPAAEGDWTNTLTRRPFMGILLDAFDDGASAGGSPRFGLAGAGPAFRGAGV